MTLSLYVCLCWGILAISSDFVSISCLFSSRSVFFLLNPYQLLRRHHLAGTRSGHLNLYCKTTKKNHSDTKELYCIKLKSVASRERQTKHDPRTNITFSRRNRMFSFISFRVLFTPWQTLFLSLGSSIYPKLMNISSGLKFVGREKIRVSFLSWIITRAEFVFFFCV